VLRFAGLVRCVVSARCRFGLAYSPRYAADELISLWADGKEAKADPKYDWEGLLKCVYCILHPSAYATLEQIPDIDFKAIRQFWDAEWAVDAFWRRMKAAAECCDYETLLRELPPRGRSLTPIAIGTQLS
jgi:hypothetical protein